MKKDQGADKAHAQHEAAQFRDVTVSCDADGEGIPVSYDLKAHGPVKSSSIPLLQTAAENVKESAGVKRNAKSSDMEVIEISDDVSDEIAHNFLAEAVTEHKAFSEKKDLTDDDMCYFCKNALFCCHYIISCTSTIKNNRGDIGYYKPVDLSALDNFTEANVIAFDLRQLLNQASISDNEDSDHNTDISVTRKELVNDCDPENACEVKSQKSGGNLKLNFHLDLSLFEQCLFEDKILPNNSICNIKDEVAIYEVDKKAVHNAVNVCPDNSYRNSYLLEIGSKRDSVIPPEREIKYEQESSGMCPSGVAPGTVSKPHYIEYSPLRCGQMEPRLDSKIHSDKETPDNPCNLLLSPVSPIFGSILKNVRKPTNTLPTCSTPKVHKKNLFSGNVKLRNIQEEGGDFTSSSTQHLEVREEKSVNAVMAGDSEILLRLNSHVSKIPSLPRPNFDLFSATEELVNFESDVEAANTTRNKEVCTSATQNSTMCTVTQLLGMVSKTVSMEKGKEFQIPSQQSTVTDAEKLVLPCEPVKGTLSGKEISKPVQECCGNALSSDIPSGFNKSHILAHMCSDAENHALKDSPSSSLNFTSTGSSRKCSHSSTGKMAAPSLSYPAVQEEMSTHSEKKSEQKCMEYDYLHDSDDDIFADLAVDCHTFSTSKQGPSVTSAGVQVVCTMEDIHEAVKSDRSEHQKVGECGDDGAGKQIVEPLLDSGVCSVATMGPEMTKISESAGHNGLPTTTVAKPSLACLSLKHKLKESPKITCIKNVSVKFMGGSPNVIPADVKRRNFGKENPPRSICDENQNAEVSNTASKNVSFGTDKEMGRNNGFEGQADWFVSLGKETTALHNNSISSKSERVTCKAATSGDDSPVLKPLVRNKKINISSTFNESGVLSPCDTNDPPQNTRISNEVKKFKSVLAQHSGWLAARKSNSDTSLEVEEGNSTRLISRVNKNKNFSYNKQMDSYVPVMKVDVIDISSEDDSDFESQCLVKLKKRYQSRGVYKTHGHEKEGKTTLNKRSKVRNMLQFLY